MTVTSEFFMPPPAGARDAVTDAAVSLRGLAGVIRKHGTCAPSALEVVAERLEALAGKADGVQRIELCELHGSQYVRGCAYCTGDLDTLEATQPAATGAGEGPDVREQFTEWLAHEMPAGTVIGDPRWWAPKIIRAFHDYRSIAQAALAAQPVPGVGGEAAWITKLRRELAVSKMTHAFTFSRDEVIELLGETPLSIISTRPAESVAQGGEAVRYESRPVDKGTPPLNPKWTPCLREDYEDFIAGKTNGFREYRATPTPATGSGGELISARPGGEAEAVELEAVAWVVFDSKQDRYVIFNPELASAIAERGLLTLPVFGQYEWLDAKINEWKPINRLPYTWERELGIQWRAHPAQAGGES